VPHPASASSNCRTCPHGDRRLWRQSEGRAGAVAIRAADERAGLKPEEVETAAMGNVVQAGAKMNPARQAAVQAGLPVKVPAMTVNRVCCSGAQAIVSAAQEILLGNANVAVAGGMENMDQAHYLVERGRWGYRLGDGQLYDSVLRKAQRSWASRVI
jgi:acetyl-CoA C-acetyltransferase